MDKYQMKIWGFVCLFLCAFLIFVAVERYYTLNHDVRAARDTFDSMPANLGPMEQKMLGYFEPKMPVASKYAIFFAVASGAMGIVLVNKSNKKETITNLEQPACIED
ncbi:MAG: hypothetical protein JEZ07_04825 [Phycisphaerae bacterium]|nr:hypothetical protein [Phycisphaerae bacterium]